jgi:VIT1/CCC1 family predicted Fe2+/Mn2+ transporter
LPTATALRDYKDIRHKRSLPKKEMRRRKLLLQRYFQSSGLGKHSKDPFHSHYSYFEDTDAHKNIEPLRQTLMHYLPPWLTYSHEEKAERKKEYSEGKVPRAVSTPVDRLARFLVALTGGSFLIVPMVIMSLNTSQTKSLVTVSLSVLLFVLILSFIVRVSNVETLVATATYAAVLVVFVGTSNGSSGGDGNSTS